MKPLLTPEHVAILLRVSAGTVHDLVRSGEIRFYAVGPEELLRFSEQQVTDYLTKNEHVAGDFAEPDESERRAAKPAEPPSLDLD